jgi:hypothetical protein
MYLINKMKKLFLIKIFLLIFVVMSFSQSDSILLEDGYYVGEYQDTLNIDYTYYLYMKYVKKIDDENQLIVLPYKHKNSQSKKNMVKIVKDKLLYLSNVEDLELLGILNDSWTIKGFDNFPYISVKDSVLFFSLNIADLETSDIEVFNFIGKIQPDNEIDAMINSEKTFNDAKIKINFIKNK